MKKIVLFLGLCGLGSSLYAQDTRFFRVSSRGIQQGEDSTNQPMVQD